MSGAVDPVFAALTAPGMPFGIAERDGLRQFVNLPADLNGLIDAARRHGDKTFIVEGERRLTFEQVFAWRDALVPLLGIGRGDRVAICMRNRAEWIVAFLAAVKAGGVPALLNSRGSPAELVAMIDEVTPALVIADSARAALLREGGHAGRILDLADLPERSTNTGESAAETAPVAPHDPAVILFTSGTTGRVKGAVLSHRALTTGLLSMQLSGVMVLHNMAQKYGQSPEALMAQMPQQAVLLVYPLFHISGLGSAFLSPLFAGTKVVIMRRWDAQEAVRLIRDEQITMFTGVPTMLWDLLNRARLEAADLSSLRNIASGGQALPVNLLEEIRAVCPQAQMGTGYGLTECRGSIAQAVGEDFVRKPASAGRVLPLVDVRVEDPQGRSLPPGEAGEIVVRGAQVMTGYWNRPEDTAAVLTGDGWLRTGDVGLIDEEGYVFIVDRTKDMVISGGENIYCAEVERVLGELPGVRECAAFGIPDERLGELLVAVVVGEGLSADALIGEVGQRLARYKAPGRVAFARDPLPRNAVGKIDKRALKAGWHELIGEPRVMAYPKDIGVIDCMLGIPEAEDRGDWFAAFRPLIKDAQTLQQFAMPAQYMFKDIPQSGEQSDYIRWTVEQMDRFNIERALVGWGDNDTSRRAKEMYGDRFFFDLPCDPNQGMDEVRRIKRIHAEVGLSAISVFPSGTLPQVAINHKYMFPLYACAVELDLPICLNVGIPGPRIPMETQKVEHLDEVCWFFPDLKIVMRHGAEPWEALAVKLMLKWPNLYYSTSAFAPKHYPKAIIDYANTRGADKVIYAGYFPMGLSLDRIFADMEHVPFKDEVWPKFLRDNARKVFKLGD